MKAVEKLKKERDQNNQITFTPLYTLSDNPLNSEHDRYDSLAIMGPFFEGSRFSTELWDVLKRVITFAKHAPAK